MSFQDLAFGIQKYIDHEIYPQLQPLNAHFLFISEPVFPFLT
jgi:hypothetical protein